MARKQKEGQLDEYTVTAHVKQQVVATVRASNALDAFTKVSAQVEDNWPESTYRVVAQRANMKRGQADRVAIPIG